MIINGSTSEYIDWTDTEGHIINVSDGGMIFADGRYHWYGQVMQDLGEGKGFTSSSATLQGIAMYGSEDLEHWEYEGIILACSTEAEGDLKAPLRFERSKIIYNVGTGKYVLWCHYVKYPGVHGTDPGTAEAGLAVSDRVNGPYKWIGAYRPIDEKGAVKDCTVYQDEDGSAYFIYDRKTSEQERCLHIVRLSDDYCSFTGEYRRIGAAFHREAPAVIKRDGYYYLITSGLSGWAPNEARYYRTTDLMGEWEDMGDPCVDDAEHNTFRSQSTYAFTERKTGRVILMSERHNTQSFLHCSYIWLPVDFHEDHTLSLTYRECWGI
ncbi:MAG: family 43 glycosylhydrolase [Firmicutes bacterium]|nr:family 43 glycosylhydrolase [Bacillota bacterium]